MNENETKTKDSKPAPKTKMKSFTDDDPCSPLAPPKLFRSISDRTTRCQFTAIPKPPPLSLPKKRPTNTELYPTVAHATVAGSDDVTASSSGYVISSSDIIDDQGWLRRSADFCRPISSRDLNEDSDRELALKLEQEEAMGLRRGDSHDFLLARQESLARRLQDEYVKEYAAHLERQAKSNTVHEMDISATGKAWKFVERVYQLHRNKAHLDEVEPVAVDAMVLFAENMFRAQEEFKTKGLPWKVDIGYHYTKEENMAKIKTGGLLSRAERDAFQIKSNFNGEVYGPGIYTGNDPESFCTYGKIGLIVARLKGWELDPVSSGKGYENGNTSISSGALVVLQKSSQCLAIIQFPRAKGHEAVQEYSVGLQLLVLEFFNEGEVELPTSRACPAKNARQAYRFPPRANSQPSKRPTNFSLSGRRHGKWVRPTELNKYTAPESLREVPVSSIYQECAHIPFVTCSICLHYLASATDTAVGLNKCGHCFHRACIDSALLTSLQCPLCREWAAKPQGKMPSGEMIIRQEPAINCAGEETSGSIVITYIIPAGIQESYHIHPGQAHGATKRTTYVPDTAAGRALVSRLRCAFMRGLTFTVGTSSTTGLENAVVWTSIPHKTSPNGGSHSYPDATFITRCNKELDHLGIPSKSKSSNNT